jgi:hypothetical protein
MARAALAGRFARVLSAAGLIAMLERTINYAGAGLSKEDDRPEGKLFDSARAQNLVADSIDVQLALAPSKHRLVPCFDGDGAVKAAPGAASLA